MVPRSWSSRLRSGLLLSFGVAIAVALPEATAQTFPTKEIRLIIPFPPGGGVDNTARIVATKLTTMGYTVVAENRAGAMGDIGYVAVAKAAPDGYTLLMGSAGNLALRHQVRSDAPYKPADYLPISLVSTVPHVIVMSGSLPPRNLKEFTSHFKSSGQSIAWGASGILGMHHLAGVMFGAATKIDILHVPYQGTGPLFPDLVAGRTHATSIEINTGLPYIQSGRLRALGIGAATRSCMLPEVPTMG